MLQIERDEMCQDREVVRRSDRPVGGGLPALARGGHIAPVQGDERFIGCFGRGDFRPEPEELVQQPGFRVAQAFDGLPDGVRVGRRLQRQRPPRLVHAAIELG